MPSEPREGLRIPPIPLGFSHSTWDKRGSELFQRQDAEAILVPTHLSLHTSSDASHSPLNSRGRFCPGGLQSGRPKQAAGPRALAPHCSSALGSSWARAGQQSKPCLGAGPRPAVTDENPPREQLPSKSSLTRKEQRELKSTRAHAPPLVPNSQNNTHRDSGDTTQDPRPSPLLG